MAWTLVLALLTLCTGPVASSEVTQPPAVSVALGQRVSITCKENLEKKYNPSWYLQKPGQAPKLLIHSDTNRTSMIPERFSTSWSVDTDTLIISRAQAQDEANYYCLTWNDNAKAHSDTGGWRSGTETSWVTLPSSPERSSPSVWSESRAAPGPWTIPHGALSAGSCPGA
ncbi:unnamed protein product [Pipistrellus nathusii]|uniref:Ig-like domain-containing protein n=1 Tax=Pipistrellus nathusii TaxID=59473 RepID=A0ABN9ZNZ0_PIPNA